MLLLLIHILHALFTRRLSAGRGVVRRGFSIFNQQTVRLLVEIDRPGVRRSVRTAFARAQGLTLAILISTAIVAGSAAAYPVDNSAVAQFIYSGLSQSSSSNLVNVEVGPPPSPATVEFMTYQPDPTGNLIAVTDYSTTDPPAASFLPILPQPPAGTVSPAAGYAEGELVVVRIIDPDQNLDPTVIDTIVVRLSVPVSGDTEILQLYEDAPDSGIFTGYIYAGTAGPTPVDGFLTAPDGSLIELTYDDNGTALVTSAPVTASRGPLWLQLSTPQRVVGPGDFVSYRLSVENVDQFNLAPGVTITQVLPPGFSYRTSTSRLNGSAVADPLIGPDGRSLTFTIGNMPPGTTSVIDFVSSVATAAPGQYPSRAQAGSSAGDLSNSAEVTVLIRDELFTNRAFLAGRVVQQEQCDQPETAVGVPGVRIFLEDGTFVITDSEGRYHVEGLEAGTHVVQLDQLTIPDYLKPVLCEDQTRFANKPSSRFVDLQGGTLWQADFYLAANKTEGEVAISLDNYFAENATAEYTVKLSGQDILIKNRQLVLTLPEGVTYLPGTAKSTDSLLADPQITENRLTFNLDDRPADWQQTVTFRTSLDSAVIAREMRAKAFLAFDSQTATTLATPEATSALIWFDHDKRQTVDKLVLSLQFDSLRADLSPADIEQLKAIAEQIKNLDILNIIISGHTDSRKVRWREGVPYHDNFELSDARARTFAEILAKELDLGTKRIITIGHGDAVPLAFADDAEAWSQNRRTEVKVFYQTPMPLTTATIAAKPGAEQKLPLVFWPVKPPVQPEPDTTIGILSQQDGQRLSYAIEAVRVRLDSRLTPQLLLDGKEIPADRIGFTLEENDNKTRLLSYIGVDFGEPGSHTLQLKGVDPFGNARFDQTLTIVRTGPVARIKVTDTSGNLADGRTPVKVQLQLFDAAGERITAETKLELRSGSLIPYQSEENRLPRTPETGMVMVDADGIARFDPVSQSGSYPVSLGFGDSTVELAIMVKPEQREWILVGLGDGTIGQNNISGNIQTLPAGVKDDFYSEGRLAFFARGQIKGEWLLTVAYDSDKEDRKDRSLKQIIDPDRYYTLYGDATDQRYSAASAEKLYVRVEKGRFYAVFGDFDTGLTTTELSRYSRSLTGLKSEYAGSNYGYNLFATETAQAFIRDEIRGDGTSGLYKLSRDDIVLNSDKIVIEVRDRYRTEQIIESRTLQRHIDYNIDYDDGSLYFKEPIVSRDENFNPVYIVADYETFNNTGSDYQYGGRAYVRTLNQRLELGASLIHEGLSGVAGDLYGADLTWRPTPATTIRGEYAGSKQRLPTGATTGAAWLAELQHTARRFDARAYYREQQADFGLGQQNASESGTRKYGVDGTWRFTKQIAFSGEAYRQDNLSTDASRTVAAANASYTNRKYLLTGGLRHANDRLATGERNSSNQAVLGADWYATNKLTLKARHEQSVGGSTQSSDYPTRTLLGADYILNRMITAFAEQEFTFGDNADTASTRLGLRATPWNGFQARTSVEQQTIEQSRRVFANLGLTQTWQINPYWSADISIDRSQTLRGQVERPIHPDQPPASGGSNDFTAISVGSNLRKQLWMWDSRLEFRTSDTEDRWGLRSGYTIEPRSGLGLSLNLFLLQENRKLTGDRTSGDLRFGLVWRPTGGRTIVLNRLDLISDRDSGASYTIDSWRIVNRLKGNWRLTNRLNLALQYGSKYVKETINSLQLSGYTDSLGGELRYDLTRRWDIALHAAALHQWEAGQISYRSGASVGFSPVTNLWISLGYNLSGFSDKDLSASEHTAQGAFLQFRFKFDQDSVKDALAWLDRS